MTADICSFSVTMPTRPGRQPSRPIWRRCVGRNGLFANGNRAENIGRARRLLGVPDATPLGDDGADADDEGGEWNACPCCGGRMIIIEIFERGCQPRIRPLAPMGIDSS